MTVSISDEKVEKNVELSLRTGFIKFIGPGSGFKFKWADIKIWV